MTLTALERKARVVCEAIVRGRAVLPKILHHLHYSGCTTNALTQCTKQLREQNWIQSQRVIASYRVLIPGRRAVPAYSLPPSFAKVLPRQPLIQNLGASLYCSLDEPRKRLLPHELLREYPWFPKHLAHGRPFYVDRRDGVRRLAMIVVELGSSPPRIVRKHQKQLSAWNDQPDFRKLLDRDLFMLVTIAATPEAAANIADQIEHCHAYPPARVMAWPKDYQHLLLLGGANDGTR